MKYRILKYNMLPPNMEDDDSVIYSVECKKHWWSKWKPVSWVDTASGNRIPELLTKAEALKKFYKLTDVTCIQCKHCYGRMGEAEYNFRRCKLRKNTFGSEEVIYGFQHACAMFQYRDKTDDSCGDCEYFYRYKGTDNRRIGGIYCIFDKTSNRIVYPNDPSCDAFKKRTK